MRKQASQPISAKSQIGSGENSKSNKTILIIILIILLAAVFIGVVFLIFTKKKDEPLKEVTQKRNTVVTLDNLDEVLQDLNNKVMDGLYEATMNVEWTFKTSSTPSEDAYVANKETNTNDVYFDIILDSTGETIYKSPVIPVGHALKDITLDSQLDAGTYTCTVVYHLTDEEQNDLGNVAVGITIRVLN